MSTGTLTISQTFDVEHCCSCGMAFAVTRQFRNEKLADRGWFYCPRGHQQHYTGKTEVQKAQERLVDAEAAAERLRRQLRAREENLQAERRRHASTKGQLTKTKRRVAHGVCPCCSRTFQQLGRHMANQHPEYVEANG